MGNGSHFIKLCRQCGTIIAQCRCFHPDKKVIYDTCKNCKQQKVTTMNHTKLVSNLCKPGNDIKDNMTAQDAHLLHMCMGLAGEVGELIDAIKKHVIYKKQVDIEHVVEEMGDIEFYLEGLRQGLYLGRDYVLEQNITKLQKRYGTGTYSDAQANERADKSPAEEPPVRRFRPKDGFHDLLNTPKGKILSHIEYDVDDICSRVAKDGTRVRMPEEMLYTLEYCVHKVKSGQWEQF